MSTDSKHNPDVSVLSIFALQPYMQQFQVRRTFISVPNSQHSEDEGTEGRSEETSPVVPHRKERRCYFNTEQHT